MRMHDYYRSLVHVEVPGGLLKTILKRGCWSWTVWKRGRKRRLQEEREDRGVLGTVTRIKE